MNFYYLDLFIICGGVGFIIYNVLAKKDKVLDNCLDLSDIKKLEAEYDEYLYVERDLEKELKNNQEPTLKNNQEQTLKNNQEHIYLDDHLVKKRKLNLI